MAATVRRRRLPPAAANAAYARLVRPPAAHASALPRPTPRRPRVFPSPRFLLRHSSGQSLHKTASAGSLNRSPCRVPVAEHKAMADRASVSVESASSPTSRWPRAFDPVSSPPYWPVSRLSAAAPQTKKPALEDPHVSSDE